MVRLGFSRRVRSVRWMWYMEDVVVVGRCSEPSGRPAAKIDREEFRQHPIRPSGRRRAAVRPCERSVTVPRLSGSPEVGNQPDLRRPTPPGIFRAQCRRRPCRRLLCHRRRALSGSERLAVVRIAAMTAFPRRARQHWTMEPGRVSAPRRHRRRNCRASLAARLVAGRAKASQLCMFSSIALKWLTISTGIRSVFAAGRRRRPWRTCRS